MTDNIGINQYREGKHYIPIRSRRGKMCGPPNVHWWICEQDRGLKYMSSFQVHENKRTKNKGRFCLNEKKLKIKIKNKSKKENTSYRTLTR